MRSRVLFALTGVLVLSAVAAWAAAEKTNAPVAPATAATAVADSTDASAITVYATATGKSYHCENCKSLAKSKKAITLEQAAKDGLTPCSVCKPPQYVLVTGADKDKVYHLATCKAVKKTDAVMSLEGASLAGAAACPACKPSVMVFVADGGKAYHCADCATLAKSKTRTGMLLDDAKKNYKPCGVCKPPA